MTTIEIKHHCANFSCERELIIDTPIKIIYLDNRKALVLSDDGFSIPWNSGWDVNFSDGLPKVFCPDHKVSK